MPDARPVWNADGSPYLGSEAEDPTIDHVIESHPTGGAMQEFDDGKEFDGKGARYLTFHLSGLSDANLDVDGYVPESAYRGEPRPGLHGRDAPRSDVVLRGGGADYETEIVLDDLAASHYRVAVATGEWRTVSTVTVDARKLTGQKILAKGKWGELRLDASAIDRLHRAERDALNAGKSFGFVGILPSAILSVSTLEPPRFATRLTRVGEEAATMRQARDGRFGETLRIGEGRSEQVAIETRPYVWVEFSNVHYDPDPARWLPAYWGQEGEAARFHQEGATLRAIVDSVPRAGGGYTHHTYAPDGRLWRDAYDTTFLDANRKEGEPAERLGAEVLIEPLARPEDNWSFVMAFASENDVLGQGLGEPLDLPDGGFRRPQTPYVQFEVRRALPWKKAGEIPPLSPSEIKRLEATLSRDGRIERDKDHQIPGAVLVLAYATGHAELLAKGGQPPPQRDRIFWAVRDPGTRARVVIRMRDGERHLTQGTAVPGLFYAKDTGPWFELNDRGDLFYEMWDSYGRKMTPLPMRDVAAFEIETQDFEAPIYLIGKVPPIVSP